MSKGSVSTKSDQSDEVSAVELGVAVVVGDSSGSPHSTWGRARCISMHFNAFFFLLVWRGLYTYTYKCDATRLQRLRSKKQKCVYRHPRREDVCVVVQGALVPLRGRREHGVIGARRAGQRKDVSRLASHSRDSDKRWRYEIRFFFFGLFVQV